MNFKNLKIVAAIGSLFFTSVFAVPASEPALFSEVVVSEISNPVTTHRVKEGETVYSIARMYNTTVAEIYILNPKAAEGIKVGDVLSVPSLKQYTVKPKETLYSISKQFGVEVNDLVDANPELKTRPLGEGQVLRIPAAKTSTVVSKPALKSGTPSSSSSSQFITHTVSPQETIYGISKRYNVTGEALMDFNPDLKNGLRNGMTLVIPVLDTRGNQVGNSTKNNTLNDVNKLSIGIVLPFINKSDGQSARFLEYYEGFLLALHEMKAKGFSANVYAFDMGSETGTDKLKSLLDTYEMKYLDVIIGGVSPQQVAVFSEFARKQNIKYVIPFPTKTNEVSNNGNVFQVNAPSSILYANVAKVFAGLFQNTNVIYIAESGQGGDRADLISALNNELSRVGIIANRVVADANLKDRLAAVLDQGKRNVIVPVSASLKMVQTVLPALKNIQSEFPAAKITLFGHTDWQTYTQYEKEFALYDTHIYTPFYLNMRDYRTAQFMEKYSRWYNGKSLINTYPKYGVLGYDTGVSFITALWKHGKNFEKKLNSLSVSSLQTPFLFKKDNPLGGYMNTGFYIVRYKEDGSIDKTEYGK